MLLRRCSPPTLLTWKPSVISVSILEMEIQRVRIHASLPGSRIITNAPVSATFSLWTSKKTLPLKIQHIACQTAEAAYFPCHKTSQFPQLKRLLCGEEGVRGSLSLLFPSASPSFNAVTHLQCHHVIGGKSSSTT